VPINKSWTVFAGTRPRDIPGTVGVYEIGDAAGYVIFVGYAGGRSLFGLRGAIAAHFAGDEGNTIIRERAACFRYEVTTSYLLRRLELLSRFWEDEGHLPEGNAASSEALPPLAHYHWKALPSAP
jgi:hypothetical protein